MRAGLGLGHACEMEMTGAKEGRERVGDDDLGTVAIGWRGLSGVT